MSTRTVLTPWESISTPGAGFNVRLIRPGLRSPLYWGKDAQGSYLFIIDFEEDVTSLFHRQEPRIQGLKARLQVRATLSAGQQLVLSLDHQDSKDMFLAFCKSLTEAIGDVDNAATRYALVTAHFSRWQRFFGTKNRGILTASQVQGLLGELAVMGMLRQRAGISLPRLVDSWNGPESSRQDFHVGNTAIEVKSLLGSSRSSVRIASEDQLSTNLANLYLLVVHLTNTPASEEGASLNATIKHLETGMPEDTRDSFMVKLEAIGYVPLPDYDQPEFGVIDYEPFLVTERFPRLVRPHLPSAVSKVSYLVDLPALQPHRTALPVMLQDLEGGDDGAAS